MKRIVYFALPEDINQESPLKDYENHGKVAVVYTASMQAIKYGGHNCHSNSKLLTAQTKIFTAITNNSQHKQKYSQQ